MSTNVEHWLKVSDLFYDMFSLFATKNCIQKKINLIRKYEFPATIQNNWEKYINIQNSFSFPLLI